MKVFKIIPHPFLLAIIPKLCSSSSHHSRVSSFLYSSASSVRPHPNLLQSCLFIPRSLPLSLYKQCPPTSIVSDDFLQPENILVLNDVTKIADFGLAKEINARLPYTEYISTRW